MKIPTFMETWRLIQRNRRCQIALGLLVVVVATALVLSRTATSVLLALTGVAAALYLFYVVSSRLDPQHVVPELGSELIRQLTQLFPARIGRSGVSPRRDPAPPLPEKFADASEPLPAPTSCYLHSIDGDSLIALASQHELVIHLMYRPGDFILQDSPLAYVYPAERLTREMREGLQKVFTFGRERSQTHDVEYVIEQLVQVACRGLSPANNEPFTAVACIDWLSAGLRALTGQPIPSPFRYDDKNHLRVVAPSTSFSQLADKSFSEIRHVSAGSPAVVIRLLEAARDLARFARRAEDRRWLRRHIDSVKEESDRYITSSQDRERINVIYQSASRAIPGDRPAPEK